MQAVVYLIVSVEEGTDHRTLLNDLRQAVLVDLADGVEHSIEAISLDVPSAQLYNPDWFVPGKIHFEAVKE